jgi:hypothetical protein
METQIVTQLQTSVLAGFRPGLFLVETTGHGLFAGTAQAERRDFRISTLPHGLQGAGPTGISPAERISWEAAGVRPPLSLALPALPPTEIRISEDARRNITPLTKRAIDHVLSFIQEESKRQFVRILSLAVTTFEDPEALDHGFVVSAYVPLQAGEALAFWDILARRLEAIGAELAPQMAHTIENMIAVEVRWGNDHGLRSS